MYRSVRLRSSFQVPVLDQRPQRRPDGVDLGCVSLCDTATTDTPMLEVILIQYNILPQTIFFLPAPQSFCPVTVYVCHSTVVFAQ